MNPEAVALTTYLFYELREVIQMLITMLCYCGINQSAQLRKILGLLPLKRMWQDRKKSNYFDKIVSLFSSTLLKISLCKMRFHLCLLCHSALIFFSFFAFSFVNKTPMLFLWFKICNVLKYFTSSHLVIFNYRNSPN